MNFWKGSSSAEVIDKLKGDQLLASKQAKVNPSLLDLKPTAPTLVHHATGDSNAQGTTGRAQTGGRDRGCHHGGEDCDWRDRRQPKIRAHKKRARGSKCSRKKLDASETPRDRKKGSSSEVEMTFHASKKTSPPKLNPNVPRIIHSIVFLILEGAKRGLTLTQYEIVKSLFLADREHLNKYGRPITFDNYVAMEHGPVPSLAYDFLKENRYMLRKYDIENLPWSREAAPEIGAKCFRYLNVQIEPSADVLSPSDFEALDAALTIVNSLGFAQIRRLTHEDPAYVEAWKGDGQNTQYPMKYELLFDTPDEETTLDLSFVSSHLH